MLKNTLTSSAILIALCSIMGKPAFANAQSPVIERAAKSADTNGDKQISLSEAVAQHMTEFDILDSDGDESITQNEISEYYQAESKNTALKKQELIISRYFESDSNQDGKVSKAERKAHYETAFEAAFSNKGKVDAINRKIEDAEKANETKQSSLKGKKERQSKGKKERQAKLQSRKKAVSTTDTKDTPTQTKTKQQKSKKKNSSKRGKEKIRATASTSSMTRFEKGIALLVEERDALLVDGKPTVRTRTYKEYCGTVSKFCIQK